MISKASPTVACIVLAAGNSSRFGAAKLLHLLPSKLSVLQQTIAQYHAMFKQITVVVRGGDAALIGQLKNSAVNTVVGHDAALGMSHSLISGVQANSSAAGWLIALGDMPYVKASTIGALLAASNEASIVQPIYLGKPGNPVVFGREFYADLISLEGDRGGKDLLNTYVANLLQIEVNDPGIHQDIDRPSDVLGQ